MRTIAAVIALALSGNCAAVPSRSIFLGFDLLSHGLNQVSHDPGANTSLLGTNYLNFHAQVVIPMTDRWAITPQLIGMPSMLFPHKAPDQGSTANYFIIGIPFSYFVNDQLDLLMGVAFMNYTIKGDGGTTVLNNGTSQSTFALPGRTEQARTAALELGVGYKAVNIRWGLETFIESVLSSRRRTYSLMLSAQLDALDF